MAKIQFDPELMQHIKAIYGDTELNGRTLKQLHQTWQSNPELIRNTARQKTAQAPVQSAPIKPRLNTSPSNAPTQMKLQTREIASDDLTGIQSFGTAFKEARNRGLKQFKWGKGVYGTQLATEVKNQSPSQQKAQPTQQVNLRPLPEPSQLYSGLPSKQGELAQGNAYIGYQVYNDRYPQARESVSWNPDILSGGEAQDIWVSRPVESQYGKENTKFADNRGFSPYEIFSYKNNLKPAYYQQGGAMANQEELQKAFMAYLIQDAAAQGVQLQSEQDLEQYAQQLGEDGIKAKYQEFMQKMQGGVMARLGAKLEYYKKLKGVCPEGEELVYFKQGGRICKACQKAQKGAMVKGNEVDKFKKGRAQYNKDMKSAKDEASRDSISINKYNDQETMSNKGHKGNFQKGKWVPDRRQYTKKDSCGSKMKVSKCGSKMKK